LIIEKSGNLSKLNLAFNYELYLDHPSRAELYKNPCEFIVPYMIVNIYVTENIPAKNYMHAMKLF